MKCSHRKLDLCRLGDSFPSEPSRPLGCRIQRYRDVYVCVHTHEYGLWFVWLGTDRALKVMHFFKKSHNFSV